jgi:hypothetical protein
MSRENVEVAQRWIEEWNRRDLTTWLAMNSSDAEIDWSRARGPQKGVYRGRSGHEAFWEVWLTFDWGEIETYDITEAGSEVVVPNTTTFRGREGSRWLRRAHSCSRSRTGRSLAFDCSKRKPRPSKPPVCASSEPLSQSNIRPRRTARGACLLTSGR